MYCSTCGAQVPEGRGRCDACGAPVARPSGFGVAAQPSAAVVEAPGVCPRCGFQGPSVSYFSRGGPLAGAIILALITMPLMGAGGILYFALRHDHRACPRCGENWGKHGERAMSLIPSPMPGGAPQIRGEVDIPEESGGYGLAWVLFFIAAVLMGVGVAAPAIPPLIMGAFAAAGGLVALNSRQRAREERRKALLVALQQPVLRLAAERGGRLTVTEVSSSLGWPFKRAEKVLDSLEDGLRVSADITDEGIIVYEFREMVHAPRLSTPPPEPLLHPGTADGTLQV